MELTIGHLPSEQVGKGYFGQREHSVQRNAVLAHAAPLATLFPLVCVFKIQFCHIPGLAAFMLNTGRKLRDQTMQFPHFRDEIRGIKCYLVDHALTECVHLLDAYVWSTDCV